jgi:hypothetical protein
MGGMGGTVIGSNSIAIGEASTSLFTREASSAILLISGLARFSTLSVIDELETAEVIHAASLLIASNCAVVSDVSTGGRVMGGITGGSIGGIDGTSIGAKFTVTVGLSTGGIIGGSMGAKFVSIGGTSMTGIGGVSTGLKVTIIGDASISDLIRVASSATLLISGEAKFSTWRVIDEAEIAEAIRAASLLIAAYCDVASSTARIVTNISPSELILKPPLLHVVKPNS